MAGLWARSAGGALAGRLLRHGCLADAAIARGPGAAAGPPTRRPRRDYVASSPQAARERCAALRRRVRGLPRRGRADVAALRRRVERIPNKRRRAQVWRCLLRCEASQRAERRDHAAARRAAFHEAVAAALLDVPASERDPGDAQMLRQILVDAPRTCPGSPLFAHDRVQALVVNVLAVGRKLVHKSNCRDAAVDATPARWVPGVASTRRTG